MVTCNHAPAQPTVLMVDDDPATAETFARMLRLSGYHAMCAYSSAEGLQQATLAHPDVMLLDLRMPLMDGVDLLERLRAIPSLRHVPAVIVTGDYFLDDATVARVCSLGAEIRFKPLWLEDVVDRPRPWVCRH